MQKGAKSVYMFQKALLIFEKEKQDEEGVEQVQKRKGNGTERGRGNKKRQEQCKSREKNKQQEIQTTFFRSSLLRFKGRNLAKTSDIQFCPKGTYTIHHNPLRVKGKEMKTKGTQKQEGTGQLNRKLEVR